MQGSIVRFDSLGSTNRYCEALDLQHVEDFTCFWALAQTDGVGQPGNRWEAAPGENLTFSLVLHPSFLPAASQFRLTQMLSLAVCDLLAEMPLSQAATIKWPNDIYVGTDKICGMLAVAHVGAGVVGSAVCGLGLNVNQCLFPAWVPNPTSLSMLTHRQYALEPLLHRLLEHIGDRYAALREGCDPQEEYLRHLMRLGRPAAYMYGGETITATITGVDSFGHLLLDCGDKQLRCGLKEIQFVW